MLGGFGEDGVDLAVMGGLGLLTIRVGEDAKGSVHASEHFFKLENELFGFRIGSSLAYVAVD